MDNSCVLKLYRMFFNKIEFDRIGIRNENQPNFELQASVAENEEGLFKVEVVLIGEKKDEYKIRIVLDGIFGFISDGTFDAKLKNRLIQTNAVAILLPYLRSEVSILTAQPDTESVVLPPLNVNELFKK